MTARGLFVTGTDTGVGKTLVACTLARGLRARGLDVGVMKPVETGAGDEGPADARALREAAGAEEDPLELVCPFAFGLPAAPTVAAAAEGRTIGVETIRRAFATLAARHALVVVEGAGGLLVPVTEDANMANLARELSLPVLVVARASLGTINHTLLTLEAVRARALPVAGVVISHAGGALTPADAANLGALRAVLGDLLVGEIPPLCAGEAPAADAIDLDAILERIES
jgi:dethiobiotin synthetase